MKWFGVSSSDAESRGHWKGDGDGGGALVNGSYISPDQAFIDANVAAALCHGNPIACRVHPEAHGVTNEWLLQNVVPHTNHFFGGQMNDANPALLLAMPLLWAAMSDEMEGRMDTDQREKIRDAYSQIVTMEGNPIVKNTLTIHQFRDQLIINEGGTIGEEIDPAAATRGAVGQAQNLNPTPAQQAQHEPALGSWLETVLD